MKFAGVIIDISHEQLDKSFQYIIPEELEGQIEIGSKVRIPFGRTVRSGYVIEITEEPEIDLQRIKPIMELQKDSVTIDNKLIKLAYWMKNYYGSTMNQALKVVVPVKEKVRESVKKTVHLLTGEKETLYLIEEANRKKYKAQARLLEALLENPITDFSLLSQKLNISTSTIKSLEEKGILELKEITMFRNAIKLNSDNRKNIVLNEEQQRVVEYISEDKDNSKPYLIKGVTGSGKTEVYMELIEKTISEGREVICLIPEISLTYQTVMRFYNRFGDIVSIINSRLSKGEKYDSFLMAKQGKIKIMIGPRSALFTPFQNLGLIIIDEEHEGAYKSENMPKYHARETAIELARLNNAKVVLGSATPSLDSYYSTKTGEYKLCTLEKRAGNAKLPRVQIVDLREEMKKGNRSIFSEALADMIEDRLNKKQQVMLFLNRRGYQGFINCRDCGYIIECPHCAVSLTEHRNGKLICHYCGHEEQFNKICPKCGSKHVGRFKAGTEKVEEETLKYFPEAKVLRMDLDTTKGKEGHAKILEKFGNGEADILIGTQMIVKGHDFPNVTLVGILLADMSLHSSDYMASERTFQLITQAAGRAGRGEMEGNVVIQTYDPENYSIVHAATQDHDAFYEDEIGFREFMEYPPVMRFMTIRIASDREQLCIDTSKLLKEISLKAADDTTRIVGPANASIYKINDIYYRMIYYKNSSHEKLANIRQALDAYIKEHEEQFKKCQIIYDFR